MKKVLLLLALVATTFASAQSYQVNYMGAMKVNSTIDITDEAVVLTTPETKYTNEIIFKYDIVSREGNVIMATYMGRGNIRLTLQESPFQELVKPKKKKRRKKKNAFVPSTHILTMDTFDDFTKQSATITYQISKIN